MQIYKTAFTHLTLLHNVTYIIHMMLVKNNDGTYSIAIKISGSNQLCIKDGKPLIFDSFEEGENYLSKLKNNHTFRTTIKS